MNYMKLISACLLGLILFLTFTIKVSAHTDLEFPKATEVQITEALQKTVPLRFLPSHPLYFLIVTKETINRFFKPSSAQKAQFDLVLAGKRLKETYLLLEKDKVKLSSKNLARYSKRLDKMSTQLVKAKSQNQDIAGLIGEMADILQHNEVLLSAIENSWQNKADSYNFDGNFKEAIESFSQTILTLDKLQPGIKDRFQIVKTTDNKTKEEPVITYVTPRPYVIEASPSAKPRRIIY